MSADPLQPERRAARRARRNASTIRTMDPGDGGTQPSYIEVPISSRLAQCSITFPSAIRSQCVGVVAKVLPVGGITWTGSAFSP